MSTEGVCEDCGARILWLRTRNRKWMPVDLQYHPELGNIKRYGDEAIVYGAEEAARLRAAGRNMRVYHGVTCRNRGMWPPAPKPPRRTRFRIIRGGRRG